jgi:hypothetical protein
LSQVKVKLLPVVISVKSQSVVEPPSLPTGEKTKDEEDLGDQPRPLKLSTAFARMKVQAPLRVFQKDGM